MSGRRGNSVTRMKKKGCESFMGLAREARSGSVRLRAAVSTYQERLLVVAKEHLRQTELVKLRFPDRYFVP